eukprot:7071338-Pyramimonas_sp.AAC.1
MGCNLWGACRWDAIVRARSDAPQAGRKRWRGESRGGSRGGSQTGRGAGRGATTATTMTITSIRTRT